MTGSPGRSPWTARPGTRQGRRSSSPPRRTCGIYEPGAKAARRLTNDEAEEELPRFSPDGAKVAFVKGNDLWFVEVATGRATRLTTDGSPTVLNGRLDWVYEEELAGRGDGRAYEWAPDSSAIAFLRLDVSKVPEYPLVDFLPTNGKLLPQRYPKPGDPNASPSVKVVGWGSPDGATTSRSVDFDGNDVLLGPGPLLDARLLRRRLHEDEPDADPDRGLPPPAVRGGRPEEPPDGDLRLVDQLARAAALPPRRLRVPVALRAERVPASLALPDGRNARRPRHDGGVGDRGRPEARRGVGRGLLHRHREGPPRAAPLPRRPRRLGPRPAHVRQGDSPGDSPPPAAGSSSTPGRTSTRPRASSCGGRTGR